jgi:transposase
MSNLFWLTDAQMARLEPFFPKSHGKPRVDDRRVLSGIIFINRNGLRWCDAPREYGPPKTLYNRWKRWGDKGIFARMMEGMAAEAAVPKPVMIDIAHMRRQFGPKHALHQPDLQFLHQPGVAQQVFRPLAAPQQLVQQFV